MIISICVCGAATAQVDNCCFVGWQCGSDQDWINGYLAYLNGECAAPAHSQTGASSPIDNCCQAGWQCNSDQDWVNGYHAYLSGQCAAPAQSQAATSTQTGLIDNCCQAGWQCNTDQEWVNGYHAYQNGQCAAPAQSQAATSTPAGMIDNCCQAGWQCNTDQEWVNGYRAYQNGQCAATQTPRGGGDSCCAHGWNCTIESDWILGRSVYADYDGQCVVPAVQAIVDGVIIEGSEAFMFRVKEALNLMRSRAPEWYAYVINGPRKIREIFWAPSSPGRVGTSFALERSINIHPNHMLYPLFTRARLIVHEVCHVQRWLAGLLRYETRIQQRTEEIICDLASQEMMDRANAPYRVRYLPAAVNRLISDGVTNIHQLANAERERAFHLLATMS